MMKKIRPATCLAALMFATTVCFSAGYKVRRDSMVYKEVEGAKLRLFVFSPRGAGPLEKRPAIVFFFGGGWSHGSPEQFFPHCRYLAERGMVAMSAEYRVRSRHGTTPFDAIADAKSAMRWIRAHGELLETDPERIAAGGGSAGGHLAAATALISGYDDPADDLRISPVPNAMVLFNPALDLTGSKRFAERFGGPEKAISGSPSMFVKSGSPPAIIFHGTRDQTVPPQIVEKFQEKMLEYGNICELILFGGESHAFFNAGRKENRFYIRTVALMDIFLQSAGFLESSSFTQKIMKTIP